MKIAIVRQRYNPFGGAERFVERALGALVADHADVTLIAREWSAPPQPGVRQVVCNPPHPRLLGGRLARDRSFARCVQAEFARGAYDITQSHERIPGCMIFRAGDGVHAAWLDHRARILAPWQRHAQHFSRYHRYVVDSERAMFAHPALRTVICNSRLVRDEVMRYYGVPAERLVVIHNGIDLDAFHPALAAQHRAATRARWEIPDAAPVILYVGSGFERKGVPRLLRAFAALRHATAHLVVVGADKTLTRMGALATELGIAQRVRLTGPQPDVRPFYGAADVFALPTLYDPFPNAVLEAMACGLPVVTSTTCGAAEVITPGRNGLVHDACDVAALTACLDTVLGGGLAADAREAARQAVQAMSIESTSQALLGLYRQLAGYNR